MTLPGTRLILKIKLEMNKYHDFMLNKIKPKSSVLAEPRWVTRCLDEYKPIFRNQNHQPEPPRKEENSFSKFLSSWMTGRESDKPPKKPPRKEKPLFAGRERCRETDRELRNAGDEIYKDILQTVQQHTTPIAPPRKGIIKGNDDMRLG